MNYSEFLFSSLLREFNANYNNLPYDEMFDKWQQLYIEYENSIYNVDDKGEYQSMCEFLENINACVLKF